MKIKTSMTYIRQLYACYSCGYADLQYIMYGYDPTYYNAGLYGWNCDIYTSGGVAISTGYRNTRGKWIPDDLIADFTAKAKAIREIYLNWQECAEKLAENRAAFFRAVAAL